MKLTKQMILFILSLKTSLFEDNKSDGYLPYNILYNLLPFSQGAIRCAIFQLANDGLVNKILSRGNEKKTRKRPLVNLSVLGKKKLENYLPALFLPRPAKFGFLLALFLNSNNQKSKNKLRRLRRELKTLGFVKLQRGVYCGWQSLAKTAEEKILKANLGREIILIPFEKALAYKTYEISYNLLGLEQITQASLEISSQIDQLLKYLKSGKRLQYKRKKQIKMVVKETFLLMRKLPNLPKTLIPPNWPVLELKKGFKELIDRVEQNLVDDTF